MKKLDVPREELLKLVAASAGKQLKEQSRVKEEIFGLAGILYDKKNDEMGTEFACLFVDSYVDCLLGIISEDALLSEVKNLLQMVGEDQLRKGIPAGLELDDAMLETIKQQSMNAAENFAIYSIPENPLDEGLKYFQSVFDCAKEKNIIPEDIFSSDKFYEQLLQKTYTREEYLEKLTRTASMLDPVMISRVGGKPPLESLVAKKIEAQEMCKRYREELKSQSEKSDLQEAIILVVDQELKKIYGK